MPAVDAALLADELDRDHRIGTPPDAPSTPLDIFDTLVSDAIAQLQTAPAFSLDDALKTQERAYVEAALRLADGNVSKAARLLGINRTTLYNRMDTLGLPRPQGSPVQ
ncbi:MAG: helix-turn-helix domain-containing protein [Rhodocyclaceae bacterium]